MDPEMLLMKRIEIEGSRSGVLNGVLRVIFVALAILKVRVRCLPVCVMERISSTPPHLPLPRGVWVKQAGTHHDVRVCVRACVCGCAAGRQAVG
jgi:hypothetical protein